MISANSFLSHLCKLLLYHSCTIIEWVCVTNRESHSLFIIFFHLTFTLPSGPHQESLITLIPLNYGDYCPELQWRVNLNEFTWIYYIDDSLDCRNKHLHQGTMKYNIKYTREYILKLKIYKHCTHIGWNAMKMV